ncbi:hypothetical protein SAMN04490189_0883 [Pseudomonas koreensis]|uniref:hypothetical protein n=1 Tax=Pseudomonas koreensis TaxID=198620 RepID=UPI0008799AF6|nr:hypothetical protein [Pseudomonas koreensis]GGK53794.1 hypothetical protein GCM10009103_55130 [Pseudomonas koreensis]SDC90545.1 hypothetical protein SAMN04490189_0883 [Pseudomonas koreensis]
MQICTTRMLALLLTLFGCTCDLYAATGPEVAHLLNNRYQNTTADCVGDHPAYFCSGVLVRGSPETGEFWKHSAIATQLGAESFSYLRADLGTRQLTRKNGVVFSDTFTAIGKFQTLDVLCAYPFTFAMTDTRPDFGCGSLAARTEPDLSSCAAQGVSDAQSWIAHFQQQGLQPDKQCSLSSQTPVLFKASLVAHQGLDGSWAARPNLLQIKNWDANATRQIPIQALFYDITQTGALLGAQKDQRDYFIATGDWLPILRMSLQQAPDGVFGFNQQDQLYTGYEVASRLSARYADTSAACRGDTAAYNCNGVLIRITDASPAFHAWNPSPGSTQRNAVAFSYPRSDVFATRLVYGKNQGLIMKELAAPAAYPLTLRCAFPFDGGTDFRSEGCNEHSYDPVRSRPCDEQGISSGEQWVALFYTLSHTSTGCSFNGSQSQFEQSIVARSFLKEADQTRHNEVVIASWPQDIGAQLPLEAFFYIAAAGKANAAFFQNDYFQQTGRFLPVVHLNLADAGHEFTYDPADQNVSDLSLPNPLNALQPVSSHSTALESSK